MPWDPPVVEDTANCVDKGCAAHWHGLGSCVNVNKEPWDMIKEKYATHNTNAATNKLCGTTSTERDCCLCMEWATQGPVHCEDKGGFLEGGQCVDIKNSDLASEEEFPLNSVDLNIKLMGANGTKLCMGQNDDGLECCQCYQRKNIVSEVTGT